LDRQSEIAFTAKKLGKSFSDRPYFHLTVACTLQTQLVYGFHSVSVIHYAKRRNIATGAGKPAKHRKLAYANKLMNYAIARNKGPVANLNVACEKGTASYHYPIADVTVVGNVGVVHNEVVVANNG